ncbi:hypothetical protein HJC23_012136 [Cyclotella cryptica]|uniref:Uncharacterized protein n=1 Tax=Cyclotella cryptica TaxID=29204 RepID=A0ABD3PMZ4_9STRA
MPSIAETPRLSVAELIARINAVSRSNPAEALAAIDSIIKAESGVSNSIKSRPIQQTQSISPPSRPSETNTIKPCPKDFFQSKNKEVVQETTEKNLDDEESESFYSSEDSTVSSMTNPTYLSLPAHCPPSVAHSTKQTVSKPHAEFTVIQDTKKQPKYSPHLFDDLEVQSTKQSSEVPTSAQSPQDKNHGAARQTSSSYSHYQNQKSDEAVSKLFSGSEDETGKRRVVKTTVGGENQRLTMLRSTSKTKSEDKMLSPSTKEDSKAVQQPSNGKNADKAWVAVPETKYFQPASNTSHSKPLTDKKHKGGDRKPSLDSTVQQQQKNESKYISHSELSQGQSIGLPSVVSDAFSGIDIDLDDGPVSNLVHYQPHSTVSEAFFGVDIDLEPTKTVSQRRQDFEYQTRSWNQKSPGGDEDQQIPPISKEKEIRSKVDSNQGWAMTPKDKKRAKVEPTLRLKGSKMLAQKFANLVKAFESDAY